MRRGYNFDMTPNGIRIYKYGAIYAYPEFRITPNTYLIYSPTLKDNVSHSFSKVITETDKVYTVKAVMKDADSIYKYGVLQDVFKIDEKDGDANAYAKNKLSELNKIKESFSIEIIEAVNSYTRAGALITVDDVNYLIESAAPLTINVSAKLTLASGADFDTAKEKITESITKYLQKNAFSVGYISYAQIGGCILACDEVADYSNLKLNNDTQNISVSETQVPVLGVVTID